MKKNKLLKAIKITLIILIVLLFVLAYFVGKQIMEEENNVTPQYSKVEDMPNVETLINQMYGQFIKMENSTNEDYYYDIYVDFKYGLYDGETSKRDFFNACIENVAQIMEYKNVRVIDTEKNIELKIVSDTENKVLVGSYINGDMNFYGHYEAQKALANYKKTPITNFNVESIEINTLLQNDWNKNKLNIGEAEGKVDDYIEYADFGINLREINKKVFNLFFDYRYEGTVVNGIKVGENLENVIQILGTPTFGSLEEKYIGYKGEKIYVFFNSEQISIYPIETHEVNVADFVKNYEEEKSIKKFVSNITDNWEDYETYAYDEYTVDLTYPLYGIKVQFGVTSDHGIIIYNNYVGKVLDNYTQENLVNLEIEIPSYIYFVEEDSVNEYERERYNLLTFNAEDTDYEDFEFWKDLEE